MSDIILKRIGNLLLWSSEAMRLGDLEHVALYQNEIRLLVNAHHK